MMFATVQLSMIFFIGGLLVEILAEPSTKFTQMIGKSLLFVAGAWASLFICVLVYCLIRGISALIIGG